MENKYYVYRHRRLDTNKIFYVGIGKGYRCFDKKKRNIFWKNVINKTEYVIEIISNKLDLNSAKELEIFLISIYGRRDLGLGTLVNLTDGGEGCLNVIVSSETREKLSKSNLGHKGYFLNKNHTEYSKLKISKALKGRNFSEKHRDNLRVNHADFCKYKNPKAKLVLDQNTGIFYECAQEAAQALGVKYTVLKSWLQGYRKNKSNLIYC